MEDDQTCSGRQPCDDDRQTSGNVRMQDACVCTQRCQQAESENWDPEPPRRENAEHSAGGKGNDDDPDEQGGLVVEAENLDGKAGDPGRGDVDDQLPYGLDRRGTGSQQAREQLRDGQGHRRPCGSCCGALTDRGGRGNRTVHPGIRVRRSDLSKGEFGARFEKVQRMPVS